MFTCHFPFYNEKIFFLSRYSLLCQLPQKKKLKQKTVHQRYCMGAELNITRLDSNESGRKLEKVIFHVSFCYCLVSDSLKFFVSSSVCCVQSTRNSTATESNGRVWVGKRDRARECLFRLRIDCAFSAGMRAHWIFVPKQKASVCIFIHIDTQTHTRDGFSSSMYYAVHCCIVLLSQWVSAFMFWHFISFSFTHTSKYANIHILASAMTFKCHTYASQLINEYIKRENEEKSSLFWFKVYLHVEMCEVFSLFCVCMLFPTFLCVNKSLAVTWLQSWSSNIACSLLFVRVSSLVQFISSFV